MDIGVNNRNKFGGIIYGGYAGPNGRLLRPLCHTGNLEVEP